MNSRNLRTPAMRAPAVPIHRGPQASAQSGSAAFLHAPNAALLIDFDNVTMGIQKDLHAELRNLLSSDIIKGKVAVQRAYADWRRYPQYIVPLTEASIDLIFAPAYGASKKNATDIRLAIDAIELVFTRPEIGTIILLSGDSDFSTLVIKLKEYGKYVIGVGIRESSSDLLVMNCDEYYSYNSLAGLVKTSDEHAEPRDPWELVTEAVKRMKQNGDVMRSDRLKQVMVEIDSSFDESNLKMAKFSRFVQEAAARGLVKVTPLENGQLEVAPPDGAKIDAAPAVAAGSQQAREASRGPRPERENGRSRGRGRGRGRDRERGPRPEAAATAEQGAQPAVPTQTFSPPLEEPIHAPRPAASHAPAMSAGAVNTGVGERLTRNEALDLVRRAVAELTSNSDAPVMAADVRAKARVLLGRDSETLSERFFLRILRDAHDADVIDLRKRGDDYEVAMAGEVAPIAAQVAANEAPTEQESQAARSAANAASLRRGIRTRTSRGGSSAPPPDLFSVGVVDLAPAAPLPVPVAAPVAAPVAVQASPTGKSPAKARGKPKVAAKKTPAPKGRASKKAAASSASADSAVAETVTAVADPAKPKLARGGGRKKAAARTES